jgi:hypothetical protein
MHPGQVSIKTWQAAHLDRASLRLGHVGDNRAMRIGAHPLTTQAE